MKNTESQQDLSVDDQNPTTQSLDQADDQCYEFSNADECVSDDSCCCC